jgi:hypothetical protein
MDATSGSAGFTEIHRAELHHINGVLIRLRHEATGANHLHIATDDVENAFSVAFKTVPGDSSGVAHILEHTVLCGSKRYPVRDPFFSMLKRSLSSFMNAFTASDWTMYPFCTANRKDFYNLLDVYLDATFFPNLDPLSFKQEGHRLDIEKDENGRDRLAIKGVVYNEMKGAMSSPDQVLARSLLEAIYPDTPYRFNSGGDPAVIPELTIESLQAFHRVHYHPSNAFFYTYGNLPLEDHLAFIQEKVLRHFTAIDPKTLVPSQPRWTSPRSAVYTYPEAPGEDVRKKSQICIGWMTADIQNTFDVLTLSLIEQILVGNAASPLRKALIDSGIGSALCDTAGFDGDNRDTIFSCGLKGVDPEDADTIERLIFSTLIGLVEKGIEPEMIEAAIHQVEFHQKEITNTPYPYGLKLLLTLAGTWFHGGEPEQTLLPDTHLDRIRREAGNGFLEERIRHHLIDNPHRVRLVLSPEPGKNQAQEAATAKKLKSIMDHMTHEDLAAITTDSLKLAALQEASEDVSVLPTLALDDIPPSVHRTPATAILPSENTVSYEAATNGIFYFGGTLTLNRMDSDDRLLLPFFCHAFSRSGTQQRDFADLSQTISRYTGGLGFSLQARTRFDANETPLPLLTVTGKSLSRHENQLFDLLNELFLEASFSNLNRLKQLALEYRAALEAMVVQGGHRLAMSLASRKLTPAAGINEDWSGIHQLRFIKTITADLSQERLEALSDRLDSLKRRLIGRKGLDIAAIGSAEDVETAIGHIRRLRDRLPNHREEPFEAPTPVYPLPSMEAWTTATAVSFVAQAFRVSRYTDEDSPCLAVMAKLMRSLYLHREIREKGGAYGGFAAYNPEEGIFALGSYRDPHVLGTLAVYRKAAAFIREGEYGAEDVKEAVLQVCSEIDKPDPPGPSARKAFFRRQVGLTDDMRDAFKGRLLQLTEREVRSAAEAHFKHLESGSSIAVITSTSKLESVKEAPGYQAIESHEI